MGLFSVDPLSDISFDETKLILIGQAFVVPEAIQQIP